MDLNSLIIFKNVADAGGFTAAAKLLHLPKSAVSQRISALERSLGVLLLRRTTRSISLTDAGERVYRAAVDIAEQQEYVQAISENMNDEASGILSVTAPPDIGTYLIGNLFKEFLKAHPRVQLRIDLSSRMVDLVQEGFDVAIRATSSGLQDSSLVSVKIGELPLNIFVAKATLKKVIIREPADLGPVEKVAFARRTDTRGGLKWILERDGERAEVPVNAALRTNDYQAALAAVRAGYGFGALPSLVCQQDVDEGRLVKVLPQWQCGVGSLYAVFPSRKLMPRKTEVFLEFLRSGWHLGQVER